MKENILGDAFKETWKEITEDPEYDKENPKCIALIAFSHGVCAMGRLFATEDTSKYIPKRDER